MTFRYVPLERTFLRVEPDQAPGEAESQVADYFAWDGLREGITWDELLTHQRVVVLGEAGMGKTREFEHQAERLGAAGHAAFFLRIENLLEPSFMDAFEAPEDFERFETWRARGAEAFFFLDSVDEARLNQPDALRKALQRFRREIGSHLEQVRLFLSCRASDWRYFKDPEELERLLSVKAPATVVQMRPLTSTQFVQLARELGLEDTQPLKEALEMAGAYSFAQRPRDVEWLVGYWQQHHSLGTSSQLTEHNIQQKLKEENDRRRPQDPLSLEKAREGAVALAAGLVLSGKAELRVPEPGLLRATTVECDARDFLPAWTDSQITALLTRGLFDEATYGRVRFHHRSIREYLAACWLVEHRRNGWSRAEFLSLFTQEVVDRRVIIKPLRGVLGWLASKDVRLQAETLQIDPALLLQEGDPEALTDESRRLLLRHLVARFADRRRIQLGSDRAMRRRFVTQALGPEIRQLLEARPKTEDIREFLLNLAADGALKECAAIALEMAMDQSEALAVRVSAIRAVAVCGHAEQRSLLVSWAHRAGELPSELVEALLTYLFPEPLELEVCVGLLRGIKMSPRFKDLSLTLLLEKELPARCPPDALEAFLEALLRLSESRDGSEKYDWIPGALSHVSIRLLETRTSQALPVELLGRAFARRLVMLTSGQGRASTSNELSEALRPRPSVRRQLFWFMVQHRPDIRPWQYRERLCIGWEDVEWLIADAIREESEQAHEVVIETVLFLWSRSGRLPGERDRMLQLAQGELRLWTPLEERTRPRSEPTTDLDAQRHVWEEQERSQQEAWRQEVLGRLPELSSGQDVETLYELVVGIASRVPKDISRRHAQSRWEVIEQEDGKEIAEAGRKGCERFWRTWKPPLPAELSYHDGNQLQVGLSGLQTELEGGLEPSKLSEAERAIATRYALLELGAFPEWLSQLVHSFPETARQVFSEAMDAEFNLRKRSDMGWSLLMKLEAATDSVARVFVPVLQERLERGEPRLEKTLRDAIEVLLRSSYTDRERLARLARGHLQARTRMNEPAGLSWFVAWLSSDGGPAWDFAEQWLAEAPHEADGKLVQLAAALEPPPRGRSSPAWRLSFYEPSTLRRMILALYRYLPADAGEGSMEPDEWRDALELRSHLCQSLVDSRGMEAQAALLALAREPLLERLRDYFLYLAERQAEENTHLDPWPPQRFAAFARGEMLANAVPRVFISYRQEDSITDTGRIRDWLEPELGTDAVFQDVYSIQPAADIMRKIEATIPMATVVLAIIGPRWSIPHVSRYVQRELEIAFAHDIPIVPVLVQGARMPGPGELPDTLQQLSRLKAQEVRPDPDFRQDIVSLMDTLLRISQVGSC
jgi:hypothetical protein